MLFIYCYNTYNLKLLVYQIVNLFCFLLIYFSKLKKMYRTIQEQKGMKREEDEENEEERRPKQQYHKDFALEPFEGVSPEYMEMSELFLKIIIHHSTPNCGFTVVSYCGFLQSFSMGSCRSLWLPFPWRRPLLCSTMS